MVKTTTNEIIIRRDFVSKPGNNDSLFAAVCTNGVAIRGAINNRRKPGPKIEIIHNLKILLCASKDGTEYYFLIMDYFDFRPRFSPVVNGTRCRYSIGAYRGRKRVVIAWFADEVSANDYLVRCRLDHPSIRFDCIRSLL